MKLAYWMYAGPAHLGTLRVASSFKNVHAIMHAPLGDDYFNVMRSMLERERDFTPVTASIVDRHVLARGSQEKVVDNITRKEKEERPDLIVLTPTCTSSILQEDLQNFVNRALTLKDSQADVLLADVNHYRVNEFQAADRTLEQIVRFYIEKAKKENYDFSKTQKISANILGVFTLGFHNIHDCRELKRLLTDLGIEINEIIPEGGSVTNLRNLPKAHFNIVPYREVGLMTAMYLKNEFQMPYISTTPMGILNTAQFIREIKTLLKAIIQTSNNFSIGDFPNDPKTNVHFGEQASKILEKDFQKYIYEQSRFVSQAAWFSRSIDCQNLTGKRAVVFGDATHAACMTKILSCEMGIRVVCSGTYCKHDADWFREQVRGFCDEILITEDHTQVGDMIGRLEPAAIFGTQMERHVGKRLDIPCGVISAPVHIQNFPLSYRPFLGYEGTNQIADLVYNSFTLGMEDHLLEIFNGHDTKQIHTHSASDIQSEDGSLEWSKDALEELSRIPGFVRGKVKRNVEKFTRQNNKTFITLELMFAAKEAVNA
uniref:photochlorophyllide reductase subunit B n=1 Tax=Tetradesmus dimorphus TaxID=119574 RepID=UPI003002E855|nr:photochlorophyllide reductase subunit B [Tetradesmus dimorphus]